MFCPHRALDSDRSHSHKYQKVAPENMLKSNAWYDRELQKGLARPEWIVPAGASAAPLAAGWDEADDDIPLGDML